MLYVIHALDKPGAAALRQQHYAAHKAFLDEAPRFGVRIVMSGPLTQDDGVTPIGSHFVLEAPDRAAAEAFHHADPFYAAGLWASSTVTAFLKRRG